ncbi:MAG: hypothetical protein AAGL24_20685 [Pseudomonadota bacterium]
MGALVALGSGTLLIGETKLAVATTRAARSADETSALVPLPSGHREVSRRRVAVDGAPAVLIRNERADDHNTGLGGEHVSWLHDDRGRLKGFVRMQQALASGTLPTKQVAQDAALDFLKRAAPDLLENLELHWIAQHDEEVTVTAGAKQVKTTVAGMKVKMRNTADGRWFWVIIGTDGAPIVFERDIVWVTMPGHRQTEKWLHDDWLAAQAIQ